MKQRRTNSGSSPVFRYIRQMENMACQGGQQAGKIVERAAFCHKGRNNHIGQQGGKNGKKP